MPQILVLCIILADAFLGLALASEQIQITATSSPASSPSYYKAQAPIIRKLGKHHQKQVPSLTGPTSPISPSVAPEAAARALDQAAPSCQTSTSEDTNNVQDIHLTKHHRSVDKSVAGGGVILGGLATTFLVAVFCYIRATGRHEAESSTTTSSSSAKSSLVL